MQITDILVIYLLVLLLLKTIARGDSRILDRTKRLTSPNKNKDTMDMAKYVVSIRSKTPQIIFGDNHFCAGAIISPKFVLTAAMCTLSDHNIYHMTRSIVIVAGTPNRLIRSIYTVTKRVTRIFAHDNYAKHGKNNIALIEVSGRWPTDNPRIGMIGLPRAEPDSQVNYMVLGWGRLYKGGPLAGNLVHIFVKLINSTTCLYMLQHLGPEMLCAGNFENKIDVSPCAGDTGDPMIYNKTLVAIVSYRLGCGISDMPSIYTDVWYHIDWINDILENAACRHRSRKVFYSLVAVLIYINLCESLGANR